MGSGAVKKGAGWPRGRGSFGCGAALGQGNAECARGLDTSSAELGAEVLNLEEILIAEAHQIGAELTWARLRQL